MIDISLFGSRGAIEAAIDLVAASWGVTVAWNQYPDDGPHAIRFDSVRIDVRFVQDTGANLRISYHGQPMADHLSSIADSLSRFAPGIPTDGVTLMETIPEDWPRFA